MSSSYFSGRVHSIVFQNDAQSFYIMRVVLDDDGKEKKDPALAAATKFGTPVTVRGNVPGIEMKIGTWFGFEGGWERHKQYGMQIRIDKAPVMKGGFTPETAVKVLSSHGVAESILNRVQVHFGDDEFLTVLGDAERLQELDGITEFTALHIVQRWKSAKSMFQTLNFLSDFNLPKMKVDQIWAFFGDEAEEVLSSDPWSLVQIDGITFEQADEVARKLGIDMSSEKRVRGAALYLLKSQRSAGHLYLTPDAITRGIKKYVRDASNQDIAKVLKQGHDECLLRLDNKTKPGVVAIYEPWFYELEVQSAQALRNRVDKAEIRGKELEEYLKSLATVGVQTEEKVKTGASLEEVAETALSEWAATSKIQLSELQQKGAVNALTQPVSILTGLPGTGKCVVPSTLVGVRGFRPIGEFLPEGVPEDDQVPLIEPIDTSRGVRNTAYVYNGGTKPTVRVTTSSGYQLEGTFEHPIRVVEDGKIVWRKLGELTLESVPVLVRGGDNYTFGSEVDLPPLVLGDFRERRYKAPAKMGDSLAQLLGYFVSEGTVTNEATLAVTNHDERVREITRQSFMDLFGCEIHDHYDKRVGGVVGVRVNSVQLRKWFAELGLGYGDAYEKEVPWAVLRGKKTHIRSFLKALFEGDGTVNADRFSVEYGTRSEKLARQVHLLLLSFGVVSSLRVEQRERHPSASPDQGTKRPWYRISVFGEDYDVFRDQIGCDFKEVPSRSTDTNTNRHLIYARSLINDLMGEVRPAKGAEYNLFYRYAKGRGPNSRRPSRAHLERLLSFAEPSATTEALRSLMRPDFFYDPVRTLEQGFSPVVDFGVPEGHEFLSNGFISHNTTTLRVVVKVLQDAGIPFLLAAPTGIAAKRLQSVTGAEASTIHRAFGAKGSSEEEREATYAGIVGDLSTESVGSDGSDQYWSYSSQPHPAKVIIIDESSMVDQHLLYRLLSCTQPEARLVFVGDAAQLPSVGPGNVLRDLVSCGQFPVVSLTEIFRQADTSDIVIAAHAIHAGKVPEFEGDSKDFKFLEIKDEGVMRDTILKTVKVLYEKKVNFQVLSPRHSGPLGVTNLNLQIRELLNPKSPGLREMRLGSETIREGDRVMVAKNNYRYEIFNGDVGKVARLDSKLKEVTIKIHGPPVMQVQLPFKEAPSHLRMAYCVTVHKSQGQEYDVIVMPWSNSFRRQLLRNLIYTAITRARKKVILVGHNSAMEIAVANSDVDTRNTLFPERLRVALESVSK